jgi:hypothetical protein
VATRSAGGAGAALSFVSRPVSKCARTPAASSAVPYTATSSARPRVNWDVVPLRMTCHGMAAGVAPAPAPLWTSAPST